MSEQITNTPHQTADMLGITPVTLRRWCEYHAVHLSAGANPLAGKARRFTGKDIEVFKHVRSLRASGLTTNDINEQLAGLTFAEIDASTDVLSVAQPDNFLAVNTDATAIVAPEYLIALEQRINARFAAVDASRRDTAVVFVAGFLAACGLFIVLLLLAVLYGGFR